MSLDHFKLFATVARHRNVTLAANELNMSQPAATKQLRLLEQNYAAKLYTKGGKGIQLTDAGRVFLRNIKRMLKLHERLTQSLKETILRSDTQSLTVGGSYSPSAVLLPALMASFTKSHRQIELNIRTENRANIERLILRGEVDIAVLNNPPPNRHLTMESFRREPSVAFVAFDHPLARKKQLTWEDVGRVGFVVRQPLVGAGASEEFLRRAKQKGAKIKVLMHCESPETVKVAVAEKIGIGILYKEVVAANIRKGEFKELKLPAEILAGQSFIVYHKTRPLSPPAQEFLKLLQTQRSKFKSQNKPAPKVQKSSLIKDVRTSGKKPRRVPQVFKLPPTEPTETFFYSNQQLWRREMRPSPWLQHLDYSPCCYPSYPPKAEWDFPHLYVRVTLWITTAFHLDTQ